MGLYQTSRDFIWHRFASKTRHGVHSPFVYSLIDQCIYRSRPKPERRFVTFFERLKQDATPLKGMDYGKNEETIVPVSVYAKQSAMPNFQVALMHRLVHYLKPASVLELGSNLGKSLAMMAAENPECELIGVEGNSSVAAYANQNLRALQLGNAKVVCSTFDAFLENDKLSFDMIFLDGDHHYEPTMRYFNAIKHRLNGGGAIVLHDLYYSDGMKRAWAEIKKDRNVTITIDLFFFGLVWLGKNQAKENFSIKFPASLLRIFF